MPDSMPLAAITYNPETGCYGFRVWFEGRPPHYEMHVFDSRENAQHWVDPHNEYVWEEAPSPDGRLSGTYVPQASDILGFIIWTQDVCQQLVPESQISAVQRLTPSVLGRGLFNGFFSLQYREQMQPELQSKPAQDLLLSY